MRLGKRESRKAHILGLEGGELRGLKEVSCHVMRIIRQSFGVSRGTKAKLPVNNQRGTDEASYQPFCKLILHLQASFQRQQAQMNILTEPRERP